MGVAKAKTNVPRTKPPGRKRSGWAAYGFLAGALLLGIAAGLTYFTSSLRLPTVSALTEATGAAKPDDTTAAAPATDPLEQRRAELAESEANLKARESKLKDQEVGVSAMLTGVTKRKSEADAVGRAAAMYSAMPPYKAGPLMQALDVEMAAQVLRLLDEDEAGAIVMYMDPARGAEIMKQLMKPVADKTGGKE